MITRRKLHIPPSKCGADFLMQALFPKSARGLHALRLAVRREYAKNFVSSKLPSSMLDMRAYRETWSLLIVSNEEAPGTTFSNGQTETWCEVRRLTKPSSSSVLVLPPLPLDRRR